MDSDENRNKVQQDNTITDRSDLDIQSNGLESGSPLEVLGEQLNLVSSANHRLAALYHKCADEASDQKSRELYLGLEQNVLRDQRELRDVMSGNLKCPQCDSLEQLPIVYGSPKPHQVKYVISGGDIVTDNDPKWSCKKCHHKWGRPLGD